MTFPNDEGIVPVSRFFVRTNRCNFLIFPKDLGIDPCKSLLDMSISSSLARDPIFDGMVPFKALL